MPIHEIVLDMPEEVVSEITEESTEESHDHELETVEVFDFAPRSQGRSGLAHRHIGVAAKAALLHIAVTNADPGDDFVQFLGIGYRLGT